MRAKIVKERLLFSEGFYYIGYIKRYWFSRWVAVSGKSTLEEEEAHLRQIVADMGKKVTIKRFEI